MTKLYIKNNHYIIKHYFFLNKKNRNMYNVIEGKDDTLDKIMSGKLGVKKTPSQANLIVKENYFKDESFNLIYSETKIKTK